MLCRGNTASAHDLTQQQEIEHFCSASDAVLLCLLCSCVDENTGGIEVVSTDTISEVITATIVCIKPRLDDHTAAD